MFDRCSIDFRQMFDRFSIDFRLIFEGWRRVGGALGEEWAGLEDWRKIGRGLEEGWRKIGGGLEEDVSIDFR